MKKCTNCDSILDGRETKYCSNKCQAEDKWKLRKEKIENGTAAPDPVPFKKIFERSKRSQM